MQEMQLAQGFHGLNRSIAPIFVPASESPDTINADLSNKTAGLLSRRRGRSRITNVDYAIIGVIPFILPGVRGRIIGSWDGTGGTGTVASKTGDSSSSGYPSDGDLMPTPNPSSTAAGAGGGLFQVVNAPWPAQNGAAPLIAGWDRIDITGLSVTQTGVGTTNGTAKTVSNGGANLADYGVLLFGGLLYVPSFGMTMADGQISLQGKIGGVWTTMMTWEVQNDVAVNITQSLLSSAGLLTEVRAVATVDSGAGTISATINISMYLVYGTLADTFTVA